MGTSENGARGEGGRNYGTKNGVGGRRERKRLPAKVVILKNPIRHANGEISASDWFGI